VTSTSAIGTGGITSGSFATGAITGDGYCADAIGLANLLRIAVTEISGAVADAVWDEARSGHTGAGTFGQGVATVQGNVTGSVASVATGGITAASFAAERLTLRDCGRCDLVIPNLQRVQQMRLRMRYWRETLRVAVAPAGW